MRRVVLDASALIIFFEDRSGAQKVEDLLCLAIDGKRDLLMSVVNWGEVYYSLWRTKDREEALSILAKLDQLPIEIMSVDKELTQIAAEIRVQHKLPYADGFAASLAKSCKAELATSDRDFALIGKQLPILWINED